MLGFFFFILILALAVKFSVPKLDSKSEPGEDNTHKYRRCEDNPVDKKHKWVLRFDNNDHRGYLICKRCDKIPGED